MDSDKELDLQSSEEDVDVGEDHPDINDDGMESEEGENGTRESLILE